jgi:hypothetical protein
MSNVIDLSSVARPVRPTSGQQSSEGVATFVAPALTPRRERRQGKPELPPPATETARNSRLRIGRRDAWWHAERLVSYWRARLDWYDALCCAQRWGVADSSSFPPAADHQLRRDLVDKWREMVAKQLLTPAPRVDAVNWKHAQFKARGFSHLPVSKKRVEQAIVDDLAFLAAHPTRARKESTHVR